MRKINFTIFSVLAIIALTSLSYKAELKELKTNYPSDKIAWLTWEEAIVMNGKAPRKIVVDIYTEWCGWCKRMDASTFSQPEIADYINANYYAVKFDAEQKEDIIFKGKTYSYIANGRRGYHALAAEITGGMLSYPTTVFLDEEMNVIQAIKGYKDANSFEQIATYFGGNNHKKLPWESYQKSYKPITNPVKN
jgi:uncharacterized protein YyaL (SSP411 family)